MMYANSQSEAIDLWNRRKFVRSTKFEIDDDGYTNLDDIEFYTEACPFCCKTPNLGTEQVSEDKEVDIVFCNCGATMYCKSYKAVILRWNNQQIKEQKNARFNSKDKEFFKR